MEHNRFMFWDIVKGLAIIAVVYGHTGASNIRIVYLYHLMLFFFVSGFLYKDKYTNDPYAYISQKIKTLLVPALKYYIIFTLLHNLFLELNIYSSIKNQPMITQVFPYNFNYMIVALSKSIFMNTWELIAGPIWFVKPLFISMTIFCIIRYFIKYLSKNNNFEPVIIIFIILLGALGFYLSSHKIVLDGRSEIALLALPIIYLGYLLNKTFKIEYLKWYYGLICTLIICFLIYKGVNIDLSANRISNPIYFYTASFCGIYLNLYLSKLIMKTKFLPKILSYLGKISFHIMALHMLFFKLANFFYVNQNNLPKYLIARYPILDSKLWFMYFFIGVLGPAMLLYIVQTIKKVLWFKYFKKSAYE